MPIANPGLCRENPYYIPQLYVESLRSAEGYLVVEGAIARRVDSCEGECFGKAIYGSLLEEFVDLVGGEVIRSFVVVLPPDYREGILVPKGARVTPVPVEGARVSIEVCEGQKVRQGDTLAYALTRKMELRHIRSHVDGVVVYIYSPPDVKISTHILLIAEEGVVKVVKVEGGHRS
jgi:hypothetical protein